MKRNISQITVEPENEETKKVKYDATRSQRKAGLLCLKKLVVDDLSDLDFTQSDEESLSSSLSSLTLEESDEESLYNPMDVETFKSILIEENDNQDELKELSNELDNVYENIKNKQVTLTKILKSNLQTFEKEKAVELFGILYNTDHHTHDYMQLHKTLSDMLELSSSQAKNNDLNIKLKELHSKMILETPTLDKIISAPISESDRMMAIEQFNIFYELGLTPSGLYSPEWFALRKKINLIINKKIDLQEYTLLNQKEDELKKLIQYEQYDLKSKILKLDADLKIKKLLYTMYEEFMICDNDHRKEQLQCKLKWLTQLPHDCTLNNTYDCVDVYKKLNEKIYGMVQVKEQMLLHLNNKQYCKKNNKIMSLKGISGCGKTSIVKALASATNTPMEKLSFGGAIDSSILLGSNQVWSHAGPSLILQMLARQGYSDIIILLDEIDKLTTSTKGIEVQNALLHILDYTQNDAFNDAYLDEYAHNLSHIWFIATLNDDSLLSQPLRDRLDIVNLPGYNKEDMILIIKNHTLPDACIQCGLNKTDLSIVDSACYLLLNHLYKDIKESGMRLVEKELNSIVSKISFLNLNKNISLSFKLKDFNSYPYVITKKTIKSLINHQHQHQDTKHLSMYG